MINVVIVVIVLINSCHISTEYDIAPQESSTPCDDHIVFDDPALAAFSKMALVGVPIEAISQKMMIQGFDDQTIKSFILRHEKQK